MKSGTVGNQARSFKNADTAVQVGTEPRWKASQGYVDMLLNALVKHRRGLDQHGGGQHCIEQRVAKRHVPDQRVWLLVMTRLAVRALSASKRDLDSWTLDSLWQSACHPTSKLSDGAPKRADS